MRFGILSIGFLVALISARANELKQLEDSVSASEARVSGLKDRVQKQFTWANPEAPQKTEYSLIYLHGFNASRDEIGELMQYWALALGANTYSTRLAGHGFHDVDVLKTASRHEWEDDADVAVAYGKQIGEKVIVIGKSTGASVGVLAAHRNPEQIDRMLLLSPNFGINRIIAPVVNMPGGIHLLKLLVGPHYHFHGINEEEARIWYPKFPIEATMTVKDVVDKVHGLDWSRELPPIMTIYDPKDGVVNPRQTVRFFEKFQSPEKELIAFDTEHNHSLFNPATESGKVNERRLFETATPFVLRSSGVDCEEIFARAYPNLAKIP